MNSRYCGTFQAKSLEDAMQAEQMIRSFLHKTGDGFECRNVDDPTELITDGIRCQENEFSNLLRRLIPFLAGGIASRYSPLSGMDLDLVKYTYSPARKEWDGRHVVLFYDVTDVLDEAEVALLKDLLASCRSETARTAETKLFEGPYTYTVGEEKSEET